MNSLHIGRKTFIPYSTLLNSELQLRCYHHGRQGHVNLVSYFIARTSQQKSIGARREKVPFSMAIENEELVQEYFPKHLRMRTARLK